MIRIGKPLGAVLLILYLVIQVLSLRIGDRRPLRTPEKIVVYLALPGQRLVSNVIGWAGGIWSHYFALVHAAKKQEQLVSERDEIAGKLAALREVQAENERLRALLELPRKEEFKLLASELISRGPSAYERVIRINRGKDSGVVPAMAVIHPKGVVGQVVEVYDHAADVLLAVDVNSAMDVVCERSRVRGILRGESFRELRFDYVPKGEDIQVGDEVVTSGLDGVYPRGLPVGTVSFVEKASKNLFLSGRVRPHVDFARLEEVAVVLRNAK